MSTNNNWWKGAVLYEIYPRSFKDNNGDGTGDLKGIIEKLEYVAALGVDGIWITPFFKSPMKDGGYDVASYRDVDPIFGDMDDFVALRTRAHELGLKVMIDLVLCHTSNEHIWFKESRQNKTNQKHDWYYWADAKEDGTPPNNWLAYFGGSAWHWDTRRQQYYLASFSKEQPSLNLWNREVKDAILDTAKFWIDLKVDGFRLDAVQQILPDIQLRDNPVRESHHPTDLDIDISNPFAKQWREYSQTQKKEVLEFIREFRNMADTHGDIALLAEAGGDNSLEDTIFYAQGKDRFHLSYCYGFTYMDITKENVERTIEKFESRMGDSWMCWAMGSHDAPRIVSRFPQQDPATQKDRACLGIALALSLRGSYCMYQGEELGLEQANVAYEDMQDIFGLMFYPEFKGRDGCRTPIPWERDAHNAGFSAEGKPWLPVYEPHHKWAVDAQEEDPTSVLHFARAFLACRKNTPALKFGDIGILETPDNIIAFTRSDATTTLLCVFNAGDAEVKWGIPGSFQPLDTVPRNNCAIKDNGVILAPYGFCILKLVK
ncbi:MAG: alpha-glucosidase [Alphaproteobacteria bacterium]|nr:alpha-glucosidase [Alphaproteobacteria bacterium]